MSSSRVSSSRAHVKATTAQLNLCSCSLGSPCMHGSEMGCILGGSSLQTLRLSPLWLPQTLETSADTLPSTAFCGSLAGCFSVLTDVFGQTAFGSCRHLLVRLLQSCRAQFFGQKGLTQSGARPCEERSAAGLFFLRSPTSSRRAGACAVHEAQEGALFISIRIVTYAQLGVLLSVVAGCTSCVQRHNLSYSVTINSCQERLGRVTVGNRRGGELFLMLV